MVQKIRAEAGQSMQVNSVLAKGIFWEARTRIFAWYIFLITFLVGLSIPIFTRLVFLQVDQRVKEDLNEEIEAFQEVIVSTSSSSTTSTQPQAAKIFDSFLRNKIPGDKTFLIATINGQFYRSSPVGLPRVINRNSKLLNRLAQKTKHIRGQNTIQDKKLAKIQYKS